MNQSFRFANYIAHRLPNKILKHNYVFKSKDVLTIVRTVSKVIFTVPNSFWSTCTEKFKEKKD